MKRIALMFAIVASTSLVALAYGDKDGKACSKDSGKKSCCSKEGAEKSSATSKATKAEPAAKAKASPAPKN